MIFESILEILSGLFIILGSLLVLIGAIGFFRFPANKISKIGGVRRELDVGPRARNKMEGAASC